MIALSYARRSVRSGRRSTDPMLEREHVPLADLRPYVGRAPCSPFRQEQKQTDMP